VRAALVLLEPCDRSFGLVVLRVRALDRPTGRPCRRQVFFVTTGSSSGADDGVNELGRLYSLWPHHGNPLKPAMLSTVFNADTVVAAGFDIAIRPDNLDVSSQHLMINEDGTTESRAVMAANGRDGSIWRFDLVKGPMGGGRR
jgi:hypothetical protein